MADLECFLCHKSLNDPRNLPCGHCFCKQCLIDLQSRLMKDTIPCPDCKVEAQLVGGVEKLPPNWTVQRALKSSASKLSRSFAPSSHVTPNCSSHPVPAILFCSKCTKLACSKCLADHSSHFTSMGSLESSVKVYLSQIDDMQTRVSSSVAEYGVQLDKLAEMKAKANQSLTDQTFIVSDLVASATKALLARERELLGDMAQRAKTFCQALDSRVSDVVQSRDLLSQSSMLLKALSSAIASKGAGGLDWKTLDDTKSKFEDLPFVPPSCSDLNDVESPEVDKKAIDKVLETIGGALKSIEVSNVAFSISSSRVVLTDVQVKVPLFGTQCFFKDLPHLTRFPHQPSDNVVPQLFSGRPSKYYPTPSSEPYSTWIRASLPMELRAITTIPFYQRFSSFEELRWKNYQDPSTHPSDGDSEATATAAKIPSFGSGQSHIPFSGVFVAGTGFGVKQAPVAGPRKFSFAAKPQTRFGTSSSSSSAASFGGTSFSATSPFAAPAATAGFKKVSFGGVGFLPTPTAVPYGQSGASRANFSAAKPSFQAAPTKFGSVAAPSPPKFGHSGAAPMKPTNTGFGGVFASNPKGTFAASNPKKSAFASNFFSSSSSPSTASSSIPTDPIQKVDPCVDLDWADSTPKKGVIMAWTRETHWKSWTISAQVTGDPAIVMHTVDEIGSLLEFDPFSAVVGAAQSVLEPWTAVSVNSEGWVSIFDMRSSTMVTEFQADPIDANACRVLIVDGLYLGSGQVFAFVDTKKNTLNAYTEDGLHLVNQTLKSPIMAVAPGKRDLLLGLVDGEIRKQDIFTRHVKIFTNSSLHSKPITALAIIQTDPCTLDEQLIISASEDLTICASLIEDPLVLWKIDIPSKATTILALPFSFTKPLLAEAVATDLSATHDDWALSSSSSSSSSWLLDSSSHDKDVPLNASFKVPSLAVVREDGQLMVLSTSDGTVIHSIRAHSGQVSCVAATSRYIITSGGSEDTGLSIWNWRTGSLRAVCKQHTSAICRLETFANGTMCASVSDDGMICIWRLGDDDTLPSLQKTMDTFKSLPEAFLIYYPDTL